MLFISAVACPHCHCDNVKEEYLAHSDQGKGNPDRNTLALQVGSLAVGQLQTVVKLFWLVTETSAIQPVLSQRGGTQHRIEMPRSSQTYNVDTTGTDARLKPLLTPSDYH